jgi:hypothetical protein
MSNLNSLQRLLGAAGAGLALCAVALPAAAQATQETQATQEAAPTADAQTVSRDATTGKLRAATPEEQATLQAMKAAKQARVAAKPVLQKFHRSGAGGIRVNDELMSTLTAVRTPDGKLQMIETQGSAPAAAPVATNTPVTE